MKNLVFLIIILTTSSCRKEEATDISGIWSLEGTLKNVSDTLQIISKLNGEEIFIVETDTGTMNITRFEDTLSSIRASENIEVLEIVMDNNEKGVLSQYSLDLSEAPAKESPRFTARNNNFWLVRMHGKELLIVDSHFNISGEGALDTLEFELLAKNKLIFDGDTLLRVDSL